MKSSLSLGSVLLVLLFLSTLSFAAKLPDGKTLYRNNCKVCHDKGSKFRQYTPMTLTQEQWRRFFSTQLVSAHRTAVHPVTGKKLLQELSPAQMKAIQRFCIDHAADSEQPATCG